MIRRNQSTSSKWREVMETMKTEAFSSPWQGAINETKYIQCMTDVLKAEDKMHFKYPVMLPYITSGEQNDVKGQGIPDYSTTNQVIIPESMSDNETVTDRFLTHLFDKHNNPLHPLFVPNVLPPVNIASILAAVTTLKLNPNMVDEHYSNNAAKAELELASMVIHQLSIGTNVHQWPAPFAPPAPDVGKFYTYNSYMDYENPSSGGYLTFGGTGCYLYAIKYALTRMANSGEEPSYDSRKQGFEKGKFLILVSDQGHYCSSNVTDWCGIGHGNVITVETDPDHIMKKEDLKKKLTNAKNDGKVVVAVVATFGSTDANSLEDIKGIREIIDEFENIKNPKTKKQYEKPFLYADSVIGWVWLLFSDYDFEKNPLGFENQSILAEIKDNSEKAKFLVEADTFAADFHKTGYSYYPASMVLLKNYTDFMEKMKRPPSAYLQPEQYDPSLYTLETSRSLVGAIGPWANFYYMGKDGMRTLIYHLMDIRNYFQKRLLSTKCAIICNPNNRFFSTLFRIYPDEYSHDKYEEELSNSDLYNSHFRPINEFQKCIYTRLYEELRMESSIAQNENTPPHISLSTGFRKTYYNSDGNGTDDDGNPLQGVFVLKCFVNTPFLDYKFVDMMVEKIIQVKNDIVNKYKIQKLDYPTQTVVIPGKLPKGSDIHNNLVDAIFIPLDKFLKKMK